MAAFYQLSTCNYQLTAAVFTTNAVIFESDTTYDGQAIVISNATVTINGAHSFNSLLLTSDVLTNLSCTATETHNSESGVWKRGEEGKGTCC